MIVYKNKEFRNLQEQVYKNQSDIAALKSSGIVLDEFGIKVVGQESSVANMPTVADYKENNPDWAYGDAYAIGTEPPYDLYILTREDVNHVEDYWFNIGEFPAPGPQGPQGETGATGPQGQTGPSGADGLSAGFGLLTATAVTLQPNEQATVTVTEDGPNTAKNLSFTFGIPQGQPGEDASVEWGDITGDISDQTDLVNTLQTKQNTLVSGTNIKTINNTSILGSGNITISGSKPEVSDFTEGTGISISEDSVNDTVEIAVDTTVIPTISSLATVATSGSYTDLSNKPSIPTKVSDLTNDSGYITSSALSGYATETWVTSQGYAESADLATVATSGSYNDLTDKPTIPVVDYPVTDVQVNSISVVNQSGVAEIDLTDYVESSDLATVATTGSYDDLTDKPTIPTVNDSTISIYNGDGDLIDAFTLNQSSNQNVNLPNIPTKATSVGDSGTQYVNPTQVRSYQTIFGIAPTLLTNINGHSLSSVYNTVDVTVGGYPAVKIRNNDGNTNLSFDESHNYMRKITGSNFTPTFGDGTVPQYSYIVDGQGNLYKPQWDSTNGLLLYKVNKLAMNSDIPTKTSDLTNDSGFITSSSLSGYATLAGGTSSSRQAFTGYNRFANSIKVGSASGAGITIDTGSIVKRANSTDYTYSLPLKSGTVAMTSDLPSTSDFVTTNTAQTITAAKTFKDTYVYLEKSDPLDPETSLNAGQLHFNSNNDFEIYADGEINLTSGNGDPIKVEGVQIATVDDVSGILSGGTVSDRQVFTGYNRFKNSLRVGGSPTGYMDIQGNGYILKNSSGTVYTIYVPAKNGTIAMTSDILGSSTETWTFTLSDNTTVTKTVVLA